MDGSRLLKLYIEYTEKGYAVLENAVSEEHIVAFEQEYPEHVRNSVDPYVSYIERPSHVRSSAVRDIMCSKLLKKFFDLSPRTYLLQMVEARAGSSQIDWHIDYFGSDEEPWDEFVVVQVCLEDVTEDSGPLEVISGSHMWKTDWNIVTNDNCANNSNSCFEYYKKSVDYYGKEPQVFLCKRGDIVLWSGYAMHRGTKPKSLEITRHSMIGRFNACDTGESSYAERLQQHNGLFYIAN
jgi:ectoine hydroxylase-related dioxygenase (phytanoyl-CoA dioxygenase family)